MSKPKSNINLTVHGARGFFSLMVYFFHIGLSRLPSFDTPIDHWIHQWPLMSLTFGVELFFGISGIVILGALPRARSMGAFAWDRMTRIYPVLWLTIIAISLVIAAGGASRGHRLPPIWEWSANFFAPPPFLNIFLVHPAAWSLGYEFTFYALMGAGWYLRKRGVTWAVVILTLIGSGLIILYPRGMLMGAGVLVAAGMGRTGWVARWSRFPGINLLIFMAIWRFASYSLDDRITHLSPLSLPILAWLGWLPVIVAAWAFGGMALLGITEGHGWLSQLLRTRFIQWMGTISYSFYLWHPVVLAMAKQIFRRAGLVEITGSWTQVVFALVAIGPALLIAHFSQTLVEVRFTKWLRKRGPHGKIAHAPVAATVTNA